MMHHELGDRWDEAIARDDLGAVLADDDVAAALAEWSLARDLLADFVDQRAETLRARVEDRPHGRETER